MLLKINLQVHMHGCMNSCMSCILAWGAPLWSMITIFSELCRPLITGMISCKQCLSMWRLRARMDLMQVIVCGNSSLEQLPYLPSSSPPYRFKSYLSPSCPSPVKALWLAGCMTVGAVTQILTNFPHHLQGAIGHTFS